MACVWLGACGSAGIWLQNYYSPASGYSSLGTTVKSYQFCFLLWIIYGPLQIWGTAAIALLEESEKTNINLKVSSKSIYLQTSYSLRLFRDKKIPVNRKQLFLLLTLWVLGGSSMACSSRRLMKYYWNTEPVLDTYNLYSSCQVEISCTAMKIYIILKVIRNPFGL